MARRANLSVSELITAKENEIVNLTEQIKKTKAEIKELKEKKKVEDSQKLLDAIASSGKTIEEVLSMIGNQQ
ncbi:MAG: hypothetical protein IJ583_08880 [Firmicutes bacterium]|nr:hypothetical protein [Bacillota bacterium]